VLKKVPEIILFAQYPKSEIFKVRNTLDSLINTYYYTEELLRRFHMNGHSLVLYILGEWKGFS